MLRRILRCFAVAALLLGAMPAIRAADYPTRPLTLVVAFTPGGASDVLSRILARKLEQILGQPIVIDNRPGAGGNVAAEAVGACRSGRLHAVHRQQCHPRHQRRALQEDQFRPGRGLRADRPDRIASQYPGGESGAAGPLHGRDRSRSPKPIRASSISPRPATAWRRISPASCSRPRPRSTSSTCPTRARRRRCRT